ncbi:unnamed protein product [Mytilus coruscus]|uniref:Uncharacterized protein n=1 Tax=Mytilus coruscus TaxID=42192 RepID=A0A6J8ADQ8_MYTCO|nr:unnamed protein product [Mytilus coruscus]
MDSKLKAVRAGHRGQVIRLLKKFEDIGKNSDLDKDEVKLIADAIEQKERTIVDLNEKILDSTSEEDVAEEIQESDNNLTEIQKFSYLKAQLHGHAAQTIALANANHTIAVNLLRERFGQPHKIIHAYMIALMEMPIPRSNQNAKVDTCCVFCDGKHHSNECTKVKDPSARIAVVKRKKLCFNCLGSLLAKECNSQNKCRKKHYTSLCEGRFVAEQKSQSVKTEGQKGEKDVPFVMHTSSTVKQHSIVLLKTAIAPLHYEHIYAETDILFDGGSSTFLHN